MTRVGVCVQCDIYGQVMMMGDDDVSACATGCATCGRIGGCAGMCRMGVGMSDDNDDG